MDDYLDPYLFTSSWSDAKIKERSCWDQLRVYQDDGNSSPLSTIGSNHSYECLAAHNNITPLPLHGVRHGLQMDSENCSANSGLPFNSALHSKEVPVTGDLNPSQSFNETGHIICNGGESSEFQTSFTGLEMETLSPITQLWHLHPYDSVPSFPTLMEHTSYMQSSYLQGENVNVDDGGNISRFIEIDKIIQPETLSASIRAKGKQDMQNSLYSSFHSNHQISNTMIGLSSTIQSAPPNPNNECNGTAKPRVRARRGQATDPHSIAERLRREKIAERLKNLQELVPNSNKTDKASTLDEIIEYVKFLQLQVKVLSMSRLGAAAAVVPLITDGQVEGFNGSSHTPLAVQGVDFSPSPDQVVFEQEVVKLMDSNVTMAMQYLQSKGLCLMPIALAAAVSNGKASSSSSSSSALVSEETKKSGPRNCHIKNDIVRNTCSGNGVVQNSNCSSSSSNSSGSLAGVGIHHIDSDGNFMILKLNGTLKQEDVNTLCTAK